MLQGTHVRDSGTAPAARPGSPTAGVHAHRVIFIDLARALAVVFMLYGHTVSALLAPEFRGGTWYDVWQFQRGLTASLFLLLSGFAFSVATARRWSSHAQPSWAVARRARRFLLFVLLGYALHLPVSRLTDLPQVSGDRWRSFVAVDVLQLIGITFLFVQTLVLLTRTPRRFSAAALLLAAGAVAATPWAWSVAWASWLPLWASAYLSPAVGSLFPLLPWMGFVLLGAALGHAFGHLGRSSLPRYATLVLLLPGAGLIAAGLALRQHGDAVFGAGPWSFVPSEVVIRAGTCLLILSALAHASRFITALPHVFGSVAQETLVIYFVHLCIVYGSVWNTGLAQTYGESLTPLQVLGVVVLLIGAMVLLAWRWNALKHAAPRGARWISYAAAGVLLAQLL